MAKKTNNPLDEGHNQPPQDEVTKNKIDKHLSDIDDTISEEDMKNINTVTGSEAVQDRAFDKEEADEIINEKSDDDNEPDKEAPSAWEILDNG